MRKISKSERLLAEEMLAMIDYASKHPTRWHDIGTSVKAAEALAKRALIEVRQPMNQYRLVRK